MRPEAVQIGLTAPPPLEMVVIHPGILGCEILIMASDVLWSRQMLKTSFALRYLRTSPGVVRMACNVCDVAGRYKS